MCSQYLCNIAYTAALLTHSLYGLPVLVMQTLVLSFRHVLCSFPSSFAFMVKKNKRVRVFTLCTLFFSAVSYKKENRQRLYNLLSIFILKLIIFYKCLLLFSIHGIPPDDFEMNYSGTTSTLYSRFFTTSLTSVSVLDPAGT